MKTINLQDYYPVYTSDTFLQVTDEVTDALAQFKRDDHAYYERRRVQRHTTPSTWTTALRTPPCIASHPRWKFTKKKLPIRSYMQLSGVCRKSRQSVSAPTSFKE